MSRWFQIQIPITMKSDYGSVSDVDDVIGSYNKVDDWLMVVLLKRK